MEPQIPFAFVSEKSPRQASETKGSALGLSRKFSQAGVDPYSLFQWETRTAVIKNAKTGEDVFRADNLEFPTHWSQNATDIVAEKYFRHVEQADGSHKRETSVRQMVERVVGTMASWGNQFGYFASADESQIFHDELVVLLLLQGMAFNSPVWFNLGTKRGRLREEQASACFILGLEDTMDSILELGTTEGRLYKGGSGSGVNYSALRSSREKLSTGGTSSGPVPFIAKDDANAGAIKSGGGTRRAAKLAVLNVDHGDIEEFIDCKAKSEKMAQALIHAGFDGDFRSRFGAYQSVPFQNANHSVRVTDEFMSAVEAGAEWTLVGRDGKVLEVLPARRLWDKICEAAYVCGDPGLMFDTTINRMHTIPAHGRINSANPCIEYMSIDDSACNLASLNLRTFQKPDGSLDIPMFQHAVDVTITAMDILVDGASYPTEKIKDNARKFRQLGLGYTNLGAYLMFQGIPYDSDKARLQAAAITALMCGRAYRQSAALAQVLGPFEGYDANRAAMLDVVTRHAVCIPDPGNSGLGPVLDAAALDWGQARTLASTGVGFRNSQATVLAPTGTISFLMDADTTGIEPDLSLVKMKKLVGGGTMRIANGGVEAALAGLGYTGKACKEIAAYVLEHGSVVGSCIEEAHLPVFDSSLPDPVGGRFLRPEAHILMMGAAQPFLSGAISKTCNIPAAATKEDIDRLYMLAWKSGLKAVALYRDGSKMTQPLQSAKAHTNGANGHGTDLTNTDTVNALKKLWLTELAEQPRRRKLPIERQSLGHKFTIGNHEGYIHAGMFEDGTLGEVFIKISKEGSTVSGLMDTIATLTSVTLQYGVPLEALVRKFRHSAFEPAGFTENAEIRHASSIIDYVFHWLELKFLKNTSIPVVDATKETARVVYTGKICPDCGHVTQRAGSCFVCGTCGWNGGCG